MGLFKHHQEVTQRPDEAASFDVLGDDGVVRRYARQDFDQIFSSTDPDEVERQVALGWLVLDESQVETPARVGTGEDLIPGIEGLRVGGVLGYEAPTSTSSYVVGYLKDGADGQAAE